jgi:hypothetical protein
MIPAVYDTVAPNSTRRRGDLPRVRLDPRRARLPQGLPGRPGRAGQPPARTQRGRPHRPGRHPRPSSTSPSRRRATAKPAWSRRWKTYGIGRPSTYASIIQTLLDARIRRSRQPALHPDRHRPGGLEVPVRAFRALRRLRLHRPARGRTRCDFARGAGLGAAAEGILAAVHRPGPREGRNRQPPGSPAGARTGHRPEIRQAGDRAPGPLRAVCPDRPGRRRGQARVCRPAPGPEDGNHHPG